MLAGGICEGVFMKDYAVYKNRSTTDTKKKKKIAPRGHKINTTLMFMLFLLFNC